MSVRRRGPKATVTRVVTYGVLSAVAVVVIFPFVVAVSTSLKRNTDIFTYPPSLIPRKDVTVSAASLGLEGDALPVFTLADAPGDFALVENDVPIGEYRPVDDPARLIAVSPELAVETDRITVVDGDEETIYQLDVDGQTRDVYRQRITVGGLFRSVDDGREIVGLVNAANPIKEFGPRLENFDEVITEKNIGRSLTNTVLVTIAVVLGQTLTSILGGYAFARIEFAGRDKIFLMYLGSVMIPFVVLIIPLFQLMLQLNWTDNLVALIVPFAFSAYGTFLMRQFFLGIPKEIEEAALLDGASRWRILWQVMVPLARPAIATLATFAFLYAWNSFFWPLVIINSGNPDNGLLTLTLSTLGGRSSTDTNLVFAGAVLAMAPPILVFLFAQRYFVENSASSGLK